MFHWLSDLQCTTTGSDGGMSKFAWFLFHFLRVLDWKVIMECDNSAALSSNHCPDGSMETSGVGSWSVVGTASIAKSTVQVKDGSQSLTMTTAATGDGVQSSTFTSMDASQAYRIAFWVWNNSGHALTLYVDTGSGSWSSLGTVADNAGVWTRYEFGFTKAASGNAKFKLVDDAGTIDAGEVYLDSLYVTRSWFEQKVKVADTNGAILAANKFSSASYSFTDADVTGTRYVCVVDRTNLGNSGIYKITGRDGANAILDIRDDGSGALMPATGLTFRVIDTADAPGVSGTASQAGAGFVLESPHTNRCRLMYRKRSDGTYENGRYFSAPEACQLNFDTMQFLKNGRSTMRNFSTDAYTTTPNEYHAFWSMCRSDSNIRVYLITDGETFIAGGFRCYGYSGNNTSFYIGFTGDDNLSLTETWLHAQTHTKYNDSNNWAISGTFTSGVYSFIVGGCAFGTKGVGCRATIASAGFGASTAYAEGMTNAKANPFSGHEYVRPVVTFVDWDGGIGDFAQMESTHEGVGHCRANLSAYQPFGTGRTWLHMHYGWAMAWHGRVALP